jgi:tetratricopeptide (TPR) repeat protein
VVIYCKLGWAYALAGDYQQSISYYNQALVIDPSDLFSLFELGKYYRIKGDNRRTKKYFDRIEKNDRSGEYVIKVEELYG